jgi:cytochrome c-type biogenesis protein CcmH/NrfG
LKILKHFQSFKTYQFKFTQTLNAMKTKIYLIATAMLLTITAFNSKAATYSDDNASKGVHTEAVVGLTEEQKLARVEEIKLRVAEIKAMDRSNMTKAERKELKQELKGLNKEAQAMGSGGVYLSVGAIIIIILVLILVL